MLGLAVVIGAAWCIAAVPIASSVFVVLPRDAEARASQPWARIDFGNQPQSAGAWTSAVSAACSVKDLEYWAPKRGYEKLAGFVERNSKVITACQREPGGFVLELRSGSGIDSNGKLIKYTFRAIEQASSGGR